MSERQQVSFKSADEGVDWQDDGKLTSMLKFAMSNLQNTHEQVLQVLERQRASMTRAQTELVQLREEKRLLQSGHAHSTAKHGMQVMPPTLLGAVEDEVIQGGLSPSQATGNRRATFANNYDSEGMSEKKLLSCHSMPPETSKPSIPSMSRQSGPPPSPRGAAPGVTSGVRRNQNQGRQKTANNLFIDAEDMKAKVRAAIGQPEYNVIDFYKTSGRCQQLARKKSFENITLGVIMFNAIWLAIDTDFNKPSEGATDPVFIVAEHVFCTYFFLEWWIRFGAFESKRNCLRDFWLLFDGFLMFVTVFETWLMQLFLLAAGTTDGGRSDHTGMIRLVRLLRIVRIARIARVLHHVPELLILVRAMALRLWHRLYATCTRQSHSRGAFCQHFRLDDNASVERNLLGQCLRCGEGNWKRQPAAFLFVHRVHSRGNADCDEHVGRHLGGGDQRHCIRGEGAVAGEQSAK